MNRLTVFPCHAAGDRAVVEELGAYLAANLDLEWCAEEGCLDSPDGLFAKIRYALQGDAALVVLSGHSSPSRWSRSEWEDVFWNEPRRLGSSVGVALVGECRFPPLLRGERFFDLTAGRREGFRRIRRWLLQLQPPPQPLYFAPPPPAPFLGRTVELETLHDQLLDRPGVASLQSDSPGAGKTALAAAFAEQTRQDFHGVFWIQCGRRSAARLAGELAAQTGARLEGEAAENLAALRRICADNRCLIVLDDLQTRAAWDLIPGGKASVLATSESGPLPGRLLRIAPWPEVPVPEPHSADWPARVRSLADDPQASFSELADALQWLFDQPASAERWMLTCRLARRAVARARDQGRLAEADELLHRWFVRAEEQADRRVLDECAWERIWILDKWNRTEEARRLEAFRRRACQDQMSFDFMAGVSAAAGPPVP